MSTLRKVKRNDATACARLVGLRERGQWWMVFTMVDGFYFLFLFYLFFVFSISGNKALWETIGGVGSMFFVLVNYYYKLK